VTHLVAVLRPLVRYLGMGLYYLGLSAAPLLPSTLLWPYPQAPTGTAEEPEPDGRAVALSAEEQRSWVALTRQLR